MISTVNLSFFRQLFYFVKFSNNLKNTKFAIFCYKQQVTPEIKKLIGLYPDITYCFIQKFEKNKMLKYLIPFFHKSMCVFSCQSKTSCFALLKQLETVLFVKINSTYYSINNFFNYQTSEYEFIQYLDNFYYSSALILTKFSDLTNIN